MAAARRIAIWLVLLLVLSGCANNADWVSLERISPPPRAALGAPPAAEPTRSVAPSRSLEERSIPEGLPDRYRVQPGDTLFSIAFRYARDFREVAAANNIQAPFVIVPGQELDMRATAPAARTAAPAAPLQPPQPGLVSSWVWPVEGTLSRTFTNSGAGPRGIFINANAGTPIRAAADGTVVYAGDGLRGYGNLIIVEHAGQMLTAYAHTDAVAVREQQRVRQGETLAQVGIRGDTPLLHFEVREGGKPVDPLRFLPPR